MTQLGTPGMQKGVLLEPFLALPLRHLPVSMLYRKLVLKEGDLLGKAFSVFMSWD
jgi:hypothetical protein